MVSQMLGEVRFLIHVKMFSYSKQKCFTNIFLTQFFCHKKLRRAYCHNPMDLYQIRPSSSLTSQFNGGAALAKKRKASTSQKTSSKKT
jgi:hypothetical protein